MFLTFKEYEAIANNIGGGHWKNYKHRWSYHRAAIDILRLFADPAKSTILEMGTMGVQLVKNSDTIDYPGKWTTFNPTFRHDAKELPWPIEDDTYDFFISLRVYHHLFPRQRECFLEAKRIAKNIIIVVPESYNVSGYETSKGITEKQFIEWNDGVPPTLFFKLADGMGNFYFWNSDALRSPPVSERGNAAPKAKALPARTMRPAVRSASPRLATTDADDVASYFSEAMSASKLPFAGNPSSVKPMVGGKSGAKLERITTDKGMTFVVKRLRDSDWWNTWVGSSSFEVDLWKLGTLNNLPAPLTTPILDAVYNTQKEEWWILMEDVEKKLLSHSRFDESSFKTFVTALAQMHAQYMDKYVGIDICSASRQFEIYTLPILTVAGRRKPDGWVSMASQRADLLAAIPLLHDALGSDGFDFYLDLCDGKNEWLNKYLDYPHTFLHGDVQFQHIAIESPDSIKLIDWNFPIVGPATSDLTWCSFLNYSCFPSSLTQNPSDFEPFKKTYLSELGRSMGGNVDHAGLLRSWHLSWLKAFAQLGWCLVNPADRSTVNSTLRARRALQQAKVIADRFL